MKMLAIVSVLVLFLAMSQPVCSQDHAPTSDQCKADMRLWSAQLDDYEQKETARIQSGFPNNSIASGWTLPQVTNRAKEMMTCTVVDRWYALEFTKTEGRLRQVYMNRLVRFVQRHNLMQQLLQEDADGLR